MTSYILRRLLICIPVLFGITVISFLMIHIAPGSPIGVALNPKVPAKVIEQWEKNFHLKEPYAEQYWFWVRDLCSGELKSFKDGIRRLVLGLPE